MSDNQLMLGPSPANPRPLGTQTNSYLVSTEISHVSYLSEHIGSLFLNDDYSDITLIVEGDRFKAHKVILASRSDYFRALLFGGMRESNQTEIELVDTGVTEFKVLLRYIYTGKVSLLQSKEDSILEILGLAHQYGFSELESGISEYLKSILTPQNLCGILGASHLYSLQSLSLYCLDYADKHASDVLSTPAFLQLTPSSVEQLISRDSFCASEIEIFRAVKEWVSVNGHVEAEVHSSIVAQIRLPLMKLEDLLNCVRASGLLQDDVLLDAIKEQNEKRTMDLKFRGFLIPDVNMATPGQGASVLEGELKQALLNGDTQSYDMERGFTRHPIDDTRPDSGIVVELGTPSILNHIRLLLWDRDQRSYSYVIDVSMDKSDWVGVVDYSAFLCRSWQLLYFSPRVVKYIRVRGRHNSMNRVFHLVALEAYFTTTNFNVHPSNGLLVPVENVATVEKSAHVIEGVSRSRNALLNGEVDHYDWDSGYTCHQLGSGSVVVQLPQPYMIGTLKLLLWDCDDRSYSYYIEVSTDQINWKMIIDKRNEQCKSWQFLRFQPCPIVFIKIVGTHNTANEVFHCVHFETPALMPNETSAEGRPNEISAEGRPNEISAEGRPNEISAEGRPNEISAEGRPNSPPSALVIPQPGPSWRNNLQGIYGSTLLHLYFIHKLFECKFVPIFDGMENRVSVDQAMVVVAQAQIRQPRQEASRRNSDEDAMDS